MLNMTHNESNEMIIFENFNDKLDKLKEWGIISSKATKIKELYYKGVYSDVQSECDVIGYLSKPTRKDCIDRTYETAIILVNEETHKIAPAYLKQMQSKKFSRYMSDDE